MQTATAEAYSYNFPTNASCVNWNQYYTNCTQLGGNPFQGTISFDNIGMAWVAIFLVISLEGWTGWLNFFGSNRWQLRCTFVKLEPEILF